MAVRILTAFLLIAQVIFAEPATSGAEPKFEDYTVPVANGLKYVPPKFATSGQRRFRTVIRGWASAGPNFGGHYTIAEWGCGTGCVQMAIVDDRTGEVYDTPIGALPRAAFCLGANPDQDKTGILYRRDSSLLILRGCRLFGQCETVYYLWNLNRFKVLRRLPLQPVFGCE